MIRKCFDVFKFKFNSFAYYLLLENVFVRDKAESGKLEGERNMYLTYFALRSCRINSRVYLFIRIQQFLSAGACCKLECKRFVRRKVSMYAMQFVCGVSGEQE